MSDAEGRPAALPRVLIAGLRGSGGKTVVSLGLAAAWRERGHAVAPFKKGPDYIDAAWLAAAAGRPCRNLDLFLFEANVVHRSFTRSAVRCDLAVIEGNRGLYDGMDARGTYSTAELAKLLRVPVILVVDCTKITGTLGAMILGCRKFDPDVEIRGVILNRVGGSRHASVLREVAEQHGGVPVLGVIPREDASPFPERHLGLVPPQEHEEVPRAVRWAMELAGDCLDLGAIEQIARTAEPLTLGEEPERPPAIQPEVRIGVFRDAAFQFYYPENLEALEREGGRLVEISPLRDEGLPDLDALYIGGGFPETFAAELAANRELHRALVEAATAGLPVYAECGGAIYLGESLTMGERTYPMAGVLPVVYGWGARPQGHGYAVIEVAAANPYLSVGESFRGHEFHYSRVLDLDEEKVSFAFRMKRGHGVDGKRDGICRRNVLATYCHLHALGATDWAGALVRAGDCHRREMRPGRDGPT